MMGVSSEAYAQKGKAAPANPVLTIEGGQVKGVKGEDPSVFIYRGIPYAAPPLGELRWKEPQPVVAWKGVKVCDTFGHPSYQAVHYPGGYGVTARNSLTAKTGSTLTYGQRLQAMQQRSCRLPCGFTVAATAKDGVLNLSSKAKNGQRRT